MWIAVRILLAIVVFCWNLFSRERAVKERRVSNNREWAYGEDRGKNSRTHVYFGMAFREPVYFSITKESDVDRFFEHIGFSEKFMTGDGTFDHEAYISCDHPTIHQTLQSDEKMRQAIETLLDSGVTKIFADGHNIWACQGNVDPTQTQLEALGVLANELNKIDTSSLLLVHDPFTWKAFAASALIWSLATYGWTGLSPTQTECIAPFSIDGGLLWHGLKIGIFIAIIALVLIIGVFRGSSRGHRIIVESFFVLLLGLPAFGMAVTSDINISLDKSQPEVVCTRVLSKEQIYHSTRHGHYYTYHLRIMPTQDQEHPDLCRRVQVPCDLYERVAGGSNVSVVVRQGALSHPWVENISLASR
jgi:hypothetical protein